MNGKGSFSLRGRNPDILTCIANLSNDEVFTPPELANRILDTLAETGLDASSWVVFFTDHGAAFPREKSTLYEAGTGIAMIVRPPTRMKLAPKVYDDLFK